LWPRSRRRELVFSPARKLFRGTAVAPPAADDIRNIAGSETSSCPVLHHVVPTTAFHFPIAVRKVVIGLPRLPRPRGFTGPLAESDAPERLTIGRDASTTCPARKRDLICRGSSPHTAHSLIPRPNYQRTTTQRRCHIIVSRYYVKRSQAHPPHFSCDTHSLPAHPSPVTTCHEIGNERCFFTLSRRVRSRALRRSVARLGTGCSQTLEMILEPFHKWFLL